MLLSPRTWVWSTTPLACLVVVACLALVGGCGLAPSKQGDEATPHAHDTDEEDVPITEADVNMPASYAEAVERITGYCNTVRTAVEDDHLHAAHAALDEMDIVLNRLPEIARDGGVPKRQWEQIVVAGEEIRDLFNEIHAAIDANGTPDYAAVAGRIEAALASLAEVIEKMNDTP